MSADKSDLDLIIACIEYGMDWSSGLAFGNRSDWATCDARVEKSDDDAIMVQLNGRRYAISVSPAG